METKTKKVVKVKVETKDALTELLKVDVYKLFDREPTGSIVGKQLNALVAKIKKLK